MKESLNRALASQRTIAENILQHTTPDARAYVLDALHEYARAADAVQRIKTVIQNEGKAHGQS